MRKCFILITILLAGSLFLTAQETQETTTQEKIELPPVKVPTSGVGFRISSFGIPNAMLDWFLDEHPTINGSSFCFEYRSYGKGGPNSTFTGVFGLEYSKMSGVGPWRVEPGDNLVDGQGEFSQISVCATVLLNIFPSFPVHPYIGAGIGFGKVSFWYEGIYTDRLGTEIKDTEQSSIPFVVGHIPVGIMANIMDKVELRVEVGFKNGFYFGAAAVYNL